jgi:hypothetical protein
VLQDARHKFAVRFRRIGRRHRAIDAIHWDQGNP